MESTIRIEGMSCGHCVGAVRTALEALEGVRVRSVEMGEAEVDYDPASVTPARIADAIREAGYDATPVGG